MTPPQLHAICAICAIWPPTRSPPGPCYMYYMCYILQGKPLNIHSLPGPCYMCYMCYRFFFNGSPNGPGRGFVFQWFAQRVCGVGVGFFQWFAQRAGRGFGFFFQWSAQRVCGVGSVFSMVRPTGPGGVSEYIFFNGPPNAPGGVSFFNGPPNGPGRGFVFQWPGGGLEGFRIFFEYWSAQRAWQVSFFNGPPNPFGLPRTPNPTGTFARLWATHVCTACKNSFFARFCTVCPRQLI